MTHFKKVAGIVLAVIAVGATAQGMANYRPNSETDALKARVAELQARLSALESKVEAMNTPRMHKATP